jgi:NTE family protein
MKKSKNGLTLVLSGGGAKCLSHIGVLEALKENNIPIKRIIGTSGGALIGGFYAAGKLDTLKKLFLNMTKKDVIKIFFHLPSADSIFASKEMDDLLKKALKRIKIEELDIPFTAVSFDISKGKKIRLRKGSLFNAIRSSISIPGIFKPLKIGKLLLVDGGVSEVLPVDAAKKYRDKILAVNVEIHNHVKSKNYNLFRVIEDSVFFQTKELAKIQEKSADFVIHINSDAKYFEFYKAKELIAHGKNATKKILPKIRKILEKR